MASSKRNPKPSKPPTTTKAQKPRAEPPGAVEVSIPNHFRCPISLDLMADPVTVSTGITYDRSSIETWLEAGRRTCPVTKREMEAGEDPIPNHSLRRMIQEWCVANHSLGVDRIPTPKVPLTAAQASEVLSELTGSSASRGGGNYVIRCRELASKVRSLAKESDQNRRRFVQAGAGRVLAALFGELAADDADVGVEILSALALMLPLDKEACRHIAASFDFVASIMRSEDPASRLNAVLVLKEVLSRGKEFAVLASRAEGLSEALVGFLREPTSPRATRSAAMAAAFCLVSSGEDAAARLLDSGLVPLVLEALVESERPMCEKALAVLDAVCSTESGREEARGHALTVPVLVKKMFRVSDAATEFVVSALWKLLVCRKCEGEEEEEMRRGVLVEATQVGAFQKVLLLLQVGCSAATKEKATQLLKMMNGHRGRLDCIDTMDLRGLRKAF